MSLTTITSGTVDTATGHDIRPHSPPLSRRASEILLEGQPHSRHSEASQSTRDRSRRKRDRPTRSIRSGAKKIRISITRPDSAGDIAAKGLSQAQSAGREMGRTFASNVLSAGLWRAPDGGVGPHVAPDGTSGFGIVPYAMGITAAGTGAIAQDRAITSALSVEQTGFSGSLTHQGQNQDTKFSFWNGGRFLVAAAGLSGTDRSGNDYAAAGKLTFDSTSFGAGVSAGWNQTTGSLYSCVDADTKLRILKERPGTEKDPPMVQMESSSTASLYGRLTLSQNLIGFHAASCIASNIRIRRWVSCGEGRNKLESKDAYWRRLMGRFSALKQLGHNLLAVPKPEDITLRYLSDLEEGAELQFTVDRSTEGGLQFGLGPAIGGLLMNRFTRYDISLKKLTNGRIELLAVPLKSHGVATILNAIVGIASASHTSANALAEKFIFDINDDPAFPGQPTEAQIALQSALDGQLPGRRERLSHAELTKEESFRLGFLDDNAKLPRGVSREFSVHHQAKITDVGVGAYLILPWVESRSEAWHQGDNLSRTMVTDGRTVSVIDRTELYTKYDTMIHGGEKNTTSCTLQHSLVECPDHTRRKVFDGLTIDYEMALDSSHDFHANGRGVNRLNRALGTKIRKYSRRGDGSSLVLNASLKFDVYSFKRLIEIYRGYVGSPLFIQPHDSDDVDDKKNRARMAPFLNVTGLDRDKAKELYDSFNQALSRFTKLQQFGLLDFDDAEDCLDEFPIRGQSVEDFADILYDNQRLMATVLRDFVRDNGLDGIGLLKQILTETPLSPPRLKRGGLRELASCQPEQSIGTPRLSVTSSSPLFEAALDEANEAIFRHGSISSSQKSSSEDSRISAQSSAEQIDAYFNDLESALSSIQKALLANFHDGPTQQFNPSIARHRQEELLDKRFKLQKLLSLEHIVLAEDRIAIYRNIKAPNALIRARLVLSEYKNRPLNGSDTAQTIRSRLEALSEARNGLNKLNDELASLGSLSEIDPAGYWQDLQEIVRLKRELDSRCLACASLSAEDHRRLFDVLKEMSSESSWLEAIKKRLGQWVFHKSIDAELKEALQLVAHSFYEQ